MNLLPLCHTLGPLETQTPKKEKTKSTLLLLKNISHYGVFVGENGWVLILFSSGFFLLHAVLHVELGIFQVRQVLISVCGAGDPRVQTALCCK